MNAARITSKGQVTIPRAIRELLGVVAGDSLQFGLDDRGQIVVRGQPESGTSHPSWMGMAKALAPAAPVSVEAMDQGIAEQVSREYRRSVGADEE